MTFFHTFRIPLCTHPILNFCRRRLSSSVEHRHSIYVSKSTNPYFNLTLEDWLFRHKNPAEPLLLIYRNDPCVVIGRNQNPWKEVNFGALKARIGVPFVRRRSGGGTVYHDLGNTNFSIHLPRQSFDRHVTAHIVLRAVRSLGVNARVNERNDICIENDKICFSLSLVHCTRPDTLFVLQVSGSAYKIVNTRAYHHGTMLISTNLGDLGDILRTNKDTMITKGVASVRSPVCNIRQSNNNVDHASFAAAVINEFRTEYGINEEVVDVKEEDFLSFDYIKRGMSELLGWEWAFGQTPEFTYTVENKFPWGKLSARILSKHGVILSCNLNFTESDLPAEDEENVRRLVQAMEGHRYGFVDDILETAPSASPAVSSVSSWLKLVIP